MITWRPIAELPDELKDGREILIWEDDSAKGNAHFAWWRVGEGLSYPSATHFAEINAPGGEAMLSSPHFHDEDAAFAFVEARMWPEGPVCPHCGGVERISKMHGGSTRKGLYKCYQCRKPFTVRMGTAFEGSHVPLYIWLQAIYLIAGSQNGISSNRLHRILGLTLKTVRFMVNRIRGPLLA